MRKSEVTDLLSKAKAATPIYLDDIKDKYGFMKATTCVQTHEDMILGNPSVLYKLDKEAITRLAESYLEALEVIEFYADKNTWYGKGYNVDTIQYYDLEELLIRDCNYAFGGKRAREFLRKMGEYEQRSGE